jgi:Na+/H+-dicarboxylate symporter
MDVSTSTSVRSDPLRWLALAAVGVGVVALLVPPPLRSALVPAAVLVAAGAGVARLVALPSIIASLVVGTACSLAITQTVSLTLMYLGWWSWQATLGVVLAVAAALVLAPRPSGATSWLDTTGGDHP